MNDWERYHAQQASYNLITIVFHPKVFLFLMLMGLVLQFSMEHKDNNPSSAHKSIKHPPVERSIK